MCPAVHAEVFPDYGLLRGRPNSDPITIPSSTASRFNMREKPCPHATTHYLIISLSIAAAGSTCERSPTSRPWCSRSRAASRVGGAGGNSNARWAEERAALELLPAVRLHATRGALVSLSLSGSSTRHLIRQRCVSQYAMPAGLPFRHRFYPPQPQPPAPRLICRHQPDQRQPAADHRGRWAADGGWAGGWQLGQQLVWGAARGCVGDSWGPSGAAAIKGYRCPPSPCAAIVHP